MKDDALALYARSLSVLMALVGVWLVASPYLLHLDALGGWWQILVGCFIAIVSSVHVALPEVHWLSLLITVAALSLVLAIFFGGAPSAVGLWNGIASSVIVAVLTLLQVSLMSDNRYIHRGHAI